MSHADRIKSEGESISPLKNLYDDYLTRGRDLYSAVTNVFSDIMVAEGVFGRSEYRTGGDFLPAKYTGQTDLLSVATGDVGKNGQQRFVFGKGLTAEISVEEVLHDEQFVQDVKNAAAKYGIAVDIREEKMPSIAPDSYELRYHIIFPVDQVVEAESKLPKLGKPGAASSR